MRQTTRDSTDQRLTLYISNDRGESWSTATHGQMSLWLGVEHMALQSNTGTDTLYLGTRYDGVYGYTAPVSTGRAEEDDTLPPSYVLHQNVPNPFNLSTQIRFALGMAAHARLTIYDALGREVARLVDRPLSAGQHHVEWRAEGHPSGTYFYRLEVGDFSTTRHMVFLR